MHLNVNISAITRELPPRLRAPFREELERRLEARIGTFTTMEDVRAIAAEVLRSMRRRQAS